MGKPKQPLLSLEAHGSVGGALTYQGTGSRKTVRAKPRIIDRLTWPRVYHRWDYVDFAYLWTLLSDADKAAWRITGNVRHITGFSAFMSYTLFVKDSIIARYHLDEPTGAQAADSGPHALHGTYFGPSSAPGFFNRARNFDGLDDYINLGNDPHFDILDELTVMARIKAVLPFAEIKAVVTKDAPVGRAWFCGITAAGLPRMFLAGGAGAAAGTIAITSGEWTTVCWQYKSGDYCRYWVDGVFALGDPGVPAMISTPSNVQIGRRDWPASELEIPAAIDEVTIWNRILDPTEILRHAERRSPL